MARWMLHVTRVGEVFVCHPGGTGTIAAEEPIRALRRLRDAALVAGPGLYHATVKQEHGGLYADLGRPFSLSAQMVTLARRLARPNTTARTGSPGIRGYQQAEDASRAAQDTARTLAKRQLAWLERAPTREADGS